MKSNIVKAKSFMHKNLRYVGMCTVCIQIFLTIITLVKTNGVSQLITSAIEANVHQTIYIAVVLVATMFMGYVINTIIEIHRSRCLEKKKHSCELTVMNHILKRKMCELYVSDTGQILENVTDDLNTSIHFYAMVLPEFYCHVLQVIVYSVYMIVLHPVIAVILLVIGCLQAVPPFIVTRYMERYYEETREVEAEITEQIIQGYQGLAEIKRNNAGRWILERFEKQHQRVCRVDMKNQMLLQGETSMDNLVNCLLTYGTFSCMGLLALYGVLSMDIALKAIVLSSAFFVSVKEIFKAWPEKRVAEVAQKRLDIWFSRQETVEEKSATLDERKISFHHFGFQYTSDSVPIFKNLDLQIPVDEKSILVGENGSGKSTLIKLIVGLIRADEGAMSVCGMDPDRWSDEVRGRCFFYVPQEDVLLSMTPYELVESSENCCAGESRLIADRFKLKREIWDTSIAKLSGGERKKVFLSMAFGMKNDIMLLLDEPTNSLDQEGVEILKDLILQRHGGMIIVSHDQDIAGLPLRKYRLVGGEVSEEVLS